MSSYKYAVDKIRRHPGFLSHEVCDKMLLNHLEPELIAAFILRKGCLITIRHDLSLHFGGRDYLANLMTETFVVHVTTQGTYTLHRWEKQVSCSEMNRLPKQKEASLLRRLFGTREELIASI
jgi:hypothetical protein